jgi:adenine-specific DNA-methyltransferase
LTKNVGPIQLESSGQGREQDFQKIKIALTSATRAFSRNALVVEGDSLELLRRLPEHSISVILTDPPYHSTKKRNIYGDTSFEEDQHYLKWMEEYAHEWKRILRPNGSFFCFCASEMAARLEVMFSKEFNILSQIVWTKPNDPGFDGWKQKMKKEALRQWYPHTERIIFAEPACDGNLNRSPFGIFLKEVRKKAGMSTYDLCEIIGAYGRVNHGGSVSNWEAGRNVPSREQYEKICEALLTTGKIHSMPPYEDVIRPFMVSADKEFTDVWTFPSVRPYKGKHPAEKPTSMLKHAIEATSFPGDIILDCFGGSGKTALAALALGRCAVCMEIDPKWVSVIASRVELLGDRVRTEPLQKRDLIKPEKSQDTRQPGLFSVAS